MESIQAVLAIIGAPILTLFGWTHVQLNGIKSDMASKVSVSLLDREIGSVRKEINLRNDYVVGRLDKLEAKIDRLIEHFQK
jgi:hypothetical protein